MGQRQKRSAKTEHVKGGSRRAIVRPLPPRETDLAFSFFNIQEPTNTATFRATHHNFFVFDVQQPTNTTVTFRACFRPWPVRIVNNTSKHFDFRLRQLSQLGIYLEEVCSCCAKESQSPAAVLHAI